MIDGILYFPYDKEYKSVPHACKVNNEVTFSIRVKNSYVIYDVRFICTFEKTNAHFEYEMYKNGEADGYVIYSATFIPHETGLYFYKFRVQTDYSYLIVSKNVKNNAIVTDKINAKIDLFQLTVYDRKYGVPEWYKGGTMYHIFVDRFCKGGNNLPKKYAKMHTGWDEQPIFLPDEAGIVQNVDFFGGDLLGVESKLDYIKSLGVTCIYFSPIFEARSNHKYDTADYMNIDSMFGTNADFERLCAKAKALGISVILDGVFSHTGDDSVYFNKYGNFDSLGAYQSVDSPYYCWYKFLKHPNEYHAWWGVKTLPDVNESVPSYNEFINGENGVIKHWLRLGAKGFRLDVADELNEDFICNLSASAKGEQDDCLIIGEVWEDASNKVSYSYRRHYFEGAQLDSVMNYPIKEGIINYIKTGNCDCFINVLHSIYDNYPEDVVHCLMNILGTHDTKRVLTELYLSHFDGLTRQQKSDICMSKSAKEKAKELLKLASLLQFTLPGVPCVYYGDEAGVEGFDDPLNRTTYPWGNEDNQLLDWYKRLGKIRNANEVFKDGSFKCLIAERGVVVFERSKANKKVVVAVNRGNSDVVIESYGLKRNALTNEKLQGVVLLKKNECILMV